MRSLLSYPAKALRVLSIIGMTASLVPDSDPLAFVLANPCEISFPDTDSICALFKGDPLLNSLMKNDDSLFPQ